MTAGWEQLIQICCPTESKLTNEPISFIVPLLPGNTSNGEVLIGTSSHICCKSTLFSYIKRASELKSNFSVGKFCFSCFSSLFCDLLCFGPHLTCCLCRRPLVAFAMNPQPHPIHGQKGQTVIKSKNPDLLSYSGVFMQGNPSPLGNFSRIITSRGFLSCC